MSDIASRQHRKPKHIDPYFKNLQEAPMTQIAILVPILATVAAIVVILRNGTDNSKRQTVRVRVREQPLEISRER